MNTATIISTIGIIISAISVMAVIYFNHTNKKSGTQKDFEERIKENTRITMKLDEICSDVKDIKHEIAQIEYEIKSHDGRLTKLEESVKQAHKRIDNHEDRIKKCESRR